MACFRFALSRNVIGLVSRSSCRNCSGPKSSTVDASLNLLPENVYERGSGGYGGVTHPQSDQNLPLLDHMCYPSSTMRNPAPCHFKLPIEHKNTAMNIGNDSSKRSCSNARYFWCLLLQGEMSIHNRSRYSAAYLEYLWWVG